MGGRPSKGTKPDKRLKENKTAPKGMPMTPKQMSRSMPKKGK